MAAGGVESPAARAWHLALGALRGSLPESSFQACFGHTAALGWDGDVFTVGAPHRFAREWIDVRYRGAAEEALAAAVGRRLELVVVTMAVPPKPPIEPPAPRVRGWASRRLAAVRSTTVAPPP